MNIQYLAFIRLPTEKAHGLQIMKTCEALAEAGAAVELVIPGRATGITEEPFSYYGTKKNFTLVALGTPDWVKAGKLGFLASLTWFAEAAKWRNGFWKADIVYSRDALVLLQYVLLGRPLVYEAHQKPTALSRFVARRARRVIVISAGLKDAYAAAGVRADRIILAPDAVNEHLFDHAALKSEARRALGVPADRRVALYAGSLRPEKGAEVLAKAASLMPDTVVLFAGAVDPTQAEFWGSVPARFLGQALHEKVIDCMKAADVLVIPNSALNDDTRLYGSPMKLFEYMASGTPIVAADVPAITEVLPRDAAFFVKPDDPQALAAGIADALASPDARTRAEKALALSKTHSWRARTESIAQRLEAV